METKNIILIGIAILVIALVAVGAYVWTSGDNTLPVLNATLPVDTNDSANVTNATADVGNATDNNTTKVVGDNSPRNDSSNVTNNNTTYKVYNPQTDSYVPVIGEKYDEGVNRWYTYDSEGVRYYNTRIN